MRHLLAAALAAVFISGTSLAHKAHADCPPQYVGPGGQIQTGFCGPAVYNSSSSGTVTLPSIGWTGSVINTGSSTLTVIGAGGASVNGTAGGSVAISSDTGATVSGDPSGWWLVIGGGGGGGVTWPTLSDIVISPGASGNPTGLAPTNNDLVYATGGAFASLATANSSILTTSSGGVPSFVTLSAAIDGLIGSTQGDILYRGASVWAVLPPGTSGQFLETLGAAANPAWASAAGSGTVNSGTAGDIAYYAATGAAVSQLAVGNGLSTAGGTLNLSSPPNDQSSAGAAIPTSDNSELLYIGAHTYTMPAAATAGNGWMVCLLNKGAGAATVNNSGDGATFLAAGGGTSITVQANGWACPASDGTNWGTPSSQAVTLPVAAGGTGVTAAQGNGSKVQLSTGSPTSGDAVKFDANGNTADAGFAAGLTHFDIGWIAGVNLSTNPTEVSIKIPVGMTITSIVGHVGVAVGGTATIDVWEAPSGTACASGTDLTNSTDFNANGTANTDQTLSGTTTAITASDRLCIVAAGGGWASSVGTGGITVWAHP